MSAETLRRARDLWLAGPMVDPDNNGWYVCHRQQKDVDWDTTVAVLEYDFHGSTAKHIASWHPAVALAVAGWLDDEAEQREARERNGHGRHRLSWQYAEAVARAYLGGEV